MMSAIIPEPFVVYWLQKFSRDGDWLLDVGCGPAVYRDASRARYVGLDLLTEPYGSESQHNIDVFAGADAIPFADASFDLVMSKSAFFQFPSPHNILQEFQRVLKPSGRLLLFDYNRRTQKRLEKAEGEKRPCWTQWQLKRLVRDAGFSNSRILLPRARAPGALEALLRPIAQELFGTWAVVTATK